MPSKFAFYYPSSLSPSLLSSTHTLLHSYFPRDLTMMHVIQIMVVHVQCTYITLHAVSTHSDRIISTIRICITRLTVNLIAISRDRNRDAAFDVHDAGNVRDAVLIQYSRTVQARACARRVQTSGSPFARHRAPYRHRSARHPPPSPGQRAPRVQRSITLDVPVPVSRDPESRVRSVDLDSGCRCAPVRNLTRLHRLWSVRKLRVIIAIAAEFQIV